MISNYRYIGRGGGGGKKRQSKEKESRRALVRRGGKEKRERGREESCIKSRDRNDEAALAAGNFEFPIERLSGPGKYTSTPRYLVPGRTLCSSTTSSTLFRFRIVWRSGVYICHFPGLALARGLACMLSSSAAAAADRRDDVLSVFPRRVPPPPHRRRR